jgi:hypothetical protein
MLVSVKENKMNHEQTSCIINVDKSIAHIIQFILNNFQYHLAPLASCGGNDENDTSYLTLYVRDLREFDRFLASVQAHLDDVNITYEQDRIFRISWPSRLNEDFIIKSE